MKTLSASYATYSVTIAGKTFTGLYEDIKAIRETAIRNGIGCSGIKRG
jgi:hypothetical protein